MFVYVSTAYSNTSQRILEEKLYPQSLNLSEIQKFAEEHYILGKDDDEMIKFIGKFKKVTKNHNVLRKNKVVFLFIIVINSMHLKHKSLTDNAQSLLRAKTTFISSDAVEFPTNFRTYLSQQLR